MNVTAIIIAALVVGGTGIFLGFFLGIFGEKFKVEVDEREEAITGVLPGNNCGGCGYAGCANLASAIVEGTAAVSTCPVGGPPVAEKIAAIMGVEAEDVGKMVAHVNCRGGHNAKRKYEYAGLQDCLAASKVAGGPLECTSGCLGFGS